jgi:hypothetical protein
LYVSGTTTTVNTSELNVADNIIIINSGETGSGVTNKAAGLKIERGSETDYYLVFDEYSQTFRIGESTADQSSQIVVSGDTQAIATREDNPTDLGVAIWISGDEPGANKFITNSNFTFNTATTTLEVSGISSSGTIIADTFSGNTLNVDTLSVGSNITVDGTITANVLSGNSLTVADITSTNLITANNINATGISGDTLDIEDNAEIGGDLTVNDIITTGFVNVGSYLDVSTTLTVTGVTTLYDNLIFGGQTLTGVTTTITSPGSDYELASTSAIVNYVDSLSAITGIDITAEYTTFFGQGYIEDGTLSDVSDITLRVTDDLKISAAGSTLTIGNEATRVRQLSITNNSTSSVGADQVLSSGGTGNIGAAIVDYYMVSGSKRQEGQIRFLIDGPSGHTIDYQGDDITFTVGFGETGDINGDTIPELGFTITNNDGSTINMSYTLRKYPVFGVIQ